MSFMETIKKVPWWGWAAGGGVALGGVMLFKKQTAGQQNSPATQAAASAVPSGLSASDLAGLPFDYQDYMPANPLGTVYGDAANNGTPADFPYTPPGWPNSPPGPPQPAPTPSTGASPFPVPGISPSGAPGPAGPPIPPPGAFSFRTGEVLTHMPTENPWLEHARPPIGH